MAPINAKGKNGTQRVVPVPLTKRAKKAGNKRRVSATTVQDLNMTDEVAAPGDDEFAQKLEVIMNILTDLSRRVKVTEDQQRERWGHHLQLVL